MSSSLTLLIDLDDTLLINPIDEFMRGYLKLLSQFLSPFVPPNLMIPQLLKSTDLMVEKAHPYRTLEETFDSDFYPALGLDTQKIKPIIDHFYNEIFPTLRDSTSPQPGAVQLIEHAITSGYKIVIATNPLFPRSAITQRLEWAGFGVDSYPFDLITSYEIMHFAKPKSAYYAEILGQLGWPDQPVCMVGNSLEFDILPAVELGFPGFLVTNGQKRNCQKPTRKINSGSIREVIPWMDSIASETFAIKPEELSAYLSLLNSTPAALATLTRGFTQSQWQFRTASAELSLSESIEEMTRIEMQNNEMITEFFKVEPYNGRIEQISRFCGEEITGSATNPNPIMINFLVARSIFVEMISGLSQNSRQKMISHPSLGRISINDLIYTLSKKDRLILKKFKEQDTLV
jgi:FMN phosphatase YigB (HAD superfamily)